MITRRLVFEIHRLANEGLSRRRIAKVLQLERATVSRYLAELNPVRPSVLRTSKLGPFKHLIDGLIEKDQHVAATVIHQRLQAHGFEWGLSILRE